ncbi:MAG: filamentous hemagglutinin N-terminal domain-containing protein [Gammaproteobacteria bacterium]|nr:filamentous hemagglutinin N-terminal domain-containing protein [Gammaproteobacteria bacterium]
MKPKNILETSPSALMIGIMLAVTSLGVSANPTGAEVIHGNVAFSQPDVNSLHITNSNGSVINWQEFSIGANETTHFQQSGANSAVLNQVVGSNGSEIMGNLTSNGQVYLINQHGIIFGENAVVNTAGFIASTLNLSNQDFIDGKLNFEGVDAGDILNQGFITAGADADIALIAPNIINEGVISVEQGDVILAAGEKLTLTSLQASDVGFEVQSASNSVLNLGSVTTDGGAVGMFAGSLTHSGIIQANALSLDANGNVILVATNDLTLSENSIISAAGDNGGRVLIQSENGTTLVSGEVSANGLDGNGGVIDVLGYQVGIIDQAMLDASGTKAGGQIHVGGNYQGSGELQNANAAFVGLDATLQANAIDSGNGGEIIVWADDATRVHGTISATGGLQNGNGGFVETSGKQFLDVAEIKLDLSAANGQAGSWLLDPNDLTISTAVDSAITAAPLFSSTGAGSNLNVDTLLAQLNVGTNVEIDTGGTGTDSGNITVATAINVTGATAVSLTLDAANDIIIDAPITSSTAALNLTLVADSGKVIAGESDGLGQIQINNIISTAGGSVTLSAGDAIAFAGAGSIDTAGGNISATTTATASSLTFGQNASLMAMNAGAGSVILNVGSVTDNSVSALDIVADQFSFITTDGFGAQANPIQLSVNTLGSASNSVTGGIYFSNNKAMTVSNIDLTNGNVIEIYNDGDLSIGTINASGASVVLDTSVASNGTTGGSILNAAAGVANIDSAFDLNLISENGIGTAASHFNLSNLQGAVSVSVAGAGSVYLDNIANIAASAFVMNTFTTNGGDIFVANQTPGLVSVIAADWNTSSGNITIESDATINVNAALSATGSALFMSSLSGDIAFNNAASLSASTVSLNAAGAITDGAAGVNTIGGGVVVDQFSAKAGNGISLTAAGNDVNQLNLASTAGDIVYTDASDINLQAAYATADGTSTGAATGNVILTAAGAIEKASASGTNIVAQNTTLTAANGIGSVAALDTQVASLSFNNQQLNNVNINNTGNLNVDSGLNSAGDIVLNTSGTLTVASNLDAAANLAVDAVTGLAINGTLSASNMDLTSAGTVSINNNVAASADLSISSDTDADGVGDVLISNTGAGILTMTAANMNISGAAVGLQATAGAVHVATTGLLNVAATADLTIQGGSIDNADAYLSAEGDISLNLAANLTLNGGSGVNSAASIFDASGQNANQLSAQIAGGVSLTAGAGDNSGAYMTAGDIDLLVNGNLDLTGTAAANGAAVINAASGSMLVDLSAGGIVNRTAGTGVGSVADLIAALGVTILDGSIVSPDNVEVINVPVDTLISTSDALVAQLDEEQPEDENAGADNSSDGKVLACR